MLDRRTRTDAFPTEKMNPPVLFTLLLMSLPVTVNEKVPPEEFTGKRGESSARI